MNSFYDTPSIRKLRVYSLDPSLAIQLDNFEISTSELSIRWEELEAGPVGEYLQVIDIDPASRRLYSPVDLNSRSSLANNGHTPSLSNPQFHQQMVYAVAMKTIENFERILGRRMLWRERYIDEKGRYIRETEKRFVPQLRIYPHALRQDNAYYSPVKVALLFGYFNAQTNDPREELPGGLVFTCLSYDIVAHETTHAILDGINRRLLDSVSNPDMLAFHEALSDIVAIFQHFSIPHLLNDQIQKTRGNLQKNNLLAQLAAQFARSTGRGSALRNALGQFDEYGNRQAPNPKELGRTTEPHARGAILVAAVFDAFIRIFENRVRDLRRLATNGTGILPDGDIHPDLTNRFAEEATHAAERVLRICVRAIDYLPPLDITFGDYLRALITADLDLYPDDTVKYRIAFIEAFRARGIFPHDVNNLGEESLHWVRFKERNWDPQTLNRFLPPRNLMRSMAGLYQAEGGMSELADHLVPKEVEEEPDVSPSDRTQTNEPNNSRSLQVANEIFLMINPYEGKRDEKDADLAANKLLEAIWTGVGSEARKSDRDIREAIFINERVFKKFLHQWLRHRFLTLKLAENMELNELVHEIAKTFGIDIRRYLKDRFDVSQVKISPLFGQQKKKPPIEVFSLRPTTRVHQDGRTQTELLIILTQSLCLPLLDANGDEMVYNHYDSDEPEKLMFRHRGGCSLILNPDKGVIEYSIVKNILSERRIENQMAFYRKQIEIHGYQAIVRFGLSKRTKKQQRQSEALAFVHSHAEQYEAY
tara:strand:+ start:20605 stop:22893 length:2289 start_codon:yes stop_codon:yes gene_type:complete